MEAVVALELGGDVLGVVIVEENDSDSFDDTVGFTDAVADVVGLAGGSEAGAGGLGFVEALEPRLAADDNDVAGLESTVTAPFVPPIVWAAGMLFKKNWSRITLMPPDRSRSAKAQTRWRSVSLVWR